MKPPAGQRRLETCVFCIPKDELGEPLLSSAIFCLRNRKNAAF